MCQVEYLAETKGTEIKRATIPPRSARLGISKETEITPKIVGVGKGRRREVEMHLYYFGEVGNTGHELIISGRREAMEVDMIKVGPEAEH